MGKGHLAVTTVFDLGSKGLLGYLPIASTEDHSHFAAAEIHMKMLKRASAQGLYHDMVYIIPLDPRFMTNLVRTLVVWNITFISRNIGNIIIPSEELIHFQ